MEDMSNHLPTRGIARLAFLSLLFLALAPTGVRAEVLTFKNNTGFPVVIQGACVIQGVVRRDKPIPLKPGDVARIALPGNKIISVYDPNQPNKPLFQGAMPASNDDLFFLIQLPNPQQPQIKIEQVKNPMGR
jgi:hypothetical protein